MYAKVPYTVVQRAMHIHPTVAEFLPTVLSAVAKHHGMKAFINMSQMTLTQMSITETTASPQHKLQWLSEQALNWSGLPVVHVRPTVFLEGFFLIFTSESVKQSNQIRLPFGEGKTSPVAAEDVARVVAALLVNPQPHIGKIYNLTGPQSENMHFYAQEYSKALGRTITFRDIPVERWRDALGGYKLLPAVDVVGRASERRVDHNVDGERGDIGWSDHAPDGKGRSELIAAVLELIAEERCRQRCVDEAGGDEVDPDGSELQREVRSEGGECGSDRRGEPEADPRVQPKVKENAEAPGSRNSISNRRSPMGAGCRISWYILWSWSVP